DSDSAITAGEFIPPNSINTTAGRELSQENAAQNGHQNHDHERNHTQGIEFPSDEVAKFGREFADGLTFRNNESDAAKNGHGSQRDDEGMDAQGHNESTIDESRGGSNPDADEHPQKDGAGGT